MPAFSRLTFASVLSALLVACGGSPQEEAMKSTVTVMDKMVAALEKVTSPETAKQAADTIKGLVPEMNKLVEAGKALGEPAKELKDKYEPQLMELKKRMMAAMGKLANYPEQANEIAEAMSKIEKD